MAKELAPYKIDVNAVCPGQDFGKNWPENELKLLWIKS